MRLPSKGKMPGLAEWLCLTAFGGAPSLPGNPEILAKAGEKLAAFQEKLPVLRVMLLAFREKLPALHMMLLAFREKLPALRVMLLAFQKCEAAFSKSWRRIEQTWVGISNSKAGFVILRDA